VGVIYDLDGEPIRLIDTDDRIVLHMQGKGYEPETLAVWARAVQPGRVALDIGAYTGLFSIIAAKRGACTVALEPMPANRWRLGINIAANKVLVEVLALAASDKVGTATLHHNPKVALTTGASLEPGNTLHRESFEVPCTTIDRLALNNIAAIKIDVERHEPAVLRGAMQTIRQERPVLLIETLGGAAHILDLLPDYRIAAVLDGRNTLFTPQ
jgi:FkbM family methyltransferase